MRQASLVAFYGPKPGELEEFLRWLQDHVRDSLRQLGVGVPFRAYSVAQIHATVVGLERRTAPGLENRNFDALRGARRVMRLLGLFEFLLRCDEFPIHVRFGGFENRDYPFRSRGARPYDRSFSVQSSAAVLVGWPVGVGRGRPRRDAVAYPTILEDLRRDAQRFNVLHRWHRASRDVDNDLYLRLGLFESELADSQRQAIEDEIRQLLSAHPPLIVKLGAADLSVVSYPADDDTLAAARTRAFPLADPRLHDADLIAALYD